MGGASSSTSHHVSEEEKEAESLASSTGSLPMLKAAFSKLATAPTNAIHLQSLRECFSVSFMNIASEGSPMPVCFPNLLNHLGPAIVDLFFVSDKESVHSVDFLRGFVRCCGRMSFSMSLITIYKLYGEVSKKAGTPLELEFESYDDDTKINGSFLMRDVLMLLWMCWIMSTTSKALKFAKGNEDLLLPDMTNLLLSVMETCNEGADVLKVLDSDSSHLNDSISAQKFHMWVLNTIPGLAHCLTRYVHSRLQNCANLQDETSPSSISVGKISLEEEAHNKTLMTRGIAWAVAVTFTSDFSELFLQTCCLGTKTVARENLIYRSCLHGKGMNRFWFSVEGYSGPMFMLVSACAADNQEAEVNVGKWIIGVLIQQGFENRIEYYGSSGTLYAISPIFHVFPPTGKDKNFVYSHLHSAGNVYEPHPKPVGIGFGGSIGHERIFIDEDFARLTIRHHAIDRTYRPGPLVPNQGFLSLEAKILEIEVWALGGKRAKEKQDAYKNRESLFSEQRRKVDLKTFASWEESPEKLMMDMMGNPNAVKREDR